MYCFRHTKNSGIFRTLFVQVYSGIFKYIQYYEGILTHIEASVKNPQACSGIFSTLCNLHIFTTVPCSKPWHIWKPGIFRTLLIRHTQNPVIVTRVYSGIIQPYSEPCVILAYEKAWHIGKPGIFRGLPRLHPDAYSEPCHSYENR